MKLNLYTIYDNKVQAYMNPFYARTNAEAIRGFATAVNQEGTDFNRWANDYCLYKVATWDPETAELVIMPMENLGLAAEYIEAKQQKLEQAVGATINDIRQAFTPASRGPKSA